jgi:hypothetical protein
LETLSSVQVELERILNQVRNGIRTLDAERQQEQSALQEQEQQ